MEPREDRFIVAAFDCQPDGRIKPNALMQYLQEAAARHAQQLGVGFADLERRDCFWVLVNFRLEMTIAPQWGNTVVVRTWPSGFTRLTAAREFIGRDATGRELFRAASEWMILDKHSSRPKNLERLGLNLPRAGDKALGAELHRLRPAEGCTPAYMLSVPFSALDFNGHVNNTEYVRWALDGLYRRCGSLPTIRSMQMTYAAEVFEGDDIEILVGEKDDDRLHILARRTERTTGASVFLMEIERGL